EAFLLVEHARVLLSEGLQANAVAQEVHRVEVIFPARIQDLNEHELLEIGELLAKEAARRLHDELARRDALVHFAVAVARGAIGSSTPNFACAHTLMKSAA